LQAKVQHIAEYGLEVNGGRIVGFDSDRLDIFERQDDFAMSMPVPLFSLGALNAPMATPLHRRMKEAGLLTEDVYAIGSPFTTNIIPKQMTRAELSVGLKWLANRLYHPAAFGERVL
jgi:hypothetical protein